MQTTIGVDIGGTAIKAVHIDPQGNVLDERTTPTVYEADALVAAVRRLAEPWGDDPLGIAAPGLADEDHRWIAWMRGPMQILEQLDWSARLDRPVPVVNDAQAATLAEAWTGAASGLRDVVLLTLGTGVGGGLILGGQLVSGRLGRVGSFGHLTLDLDGEPDLVGTPGSLEDLVGNHSVERRTGYASTELLVKAAQAGEPEAIKGWQRTIHALACGINTIINTVSPQAVVLGGGISQAGEALFDPLRKAVGGMEWQPDNQPTPILPARLGTWAGAIGAAYFAQHGARLPTA
ncbi:MAG: ROK family protein [Planctomycetota bacterium]